MYGIVVIFILSCPDRADLTALQVLNAYLDTYFLPVKAKPTFGNCLPTYLKTVPNSWLGTGNICIALCFTS